MDIYKLTIVSLFSRTNKPLRSEKNREGIDPFDIVLTKKDGRYGVKSDYFEDEGSSFHPVVVYEEADVFILVFQSGDEAMYLHAYYD